MQPLDCNAVQSSVVQDHNSISIEGEALEGEQRVVRLHHHVTGLVLVREDTASQHIHASACFCGIASQPLSAQKKAGSFCTLPHEGNINGTHDGMLSRLQGKPLWKRQV